jgi:hypothetical protein
MNPANRQWLEENRDRVLKDLNHGAIHKFPRGKAGMILQHEFGISMSIDEDDFESLARAIRLLFSEYDKWLATQKKEETAPGIPAKKK